MPSSRSWRLPLKRAKGSAWFPPCCRERRKNFCTKSNSIPFRSLRMGEMLVIPRYDPPFWAIFIYKTFATKSSSPPLGPVMAACRPKTGVSNASPFGNGDWPFECNAIVPKLQFYIPFTSTHVRPIIHGKCSSSGYSA